MTVRYMAWIGAMTLCVWVLVDRVRPFHEVERGTFRTEQECRRELGRLLPENPAYNQFTLKCVAEDR